MGQLPPLPKPAEELGVARHGLQVSLALGLIWVLVGVPLRTSGQAPSVTTGGVQTQILTHPKLFGPVGDGGGSWGGGGSRVKMIPSSRDSF